MSAAGLCWSDVHHLARQGLSFAVKCRIEVLYLGATFDCMQVLLHES